MPTVSDEIRKHITSRVHLAAGGNTNRTPKDLAIDLIHASGEDYAKIAEGTFLCKATVQRLAEEVTQRPQDETITRVNRYFGVRYDVSLTKVTSAYQNQPKE